MNYRNLIHTPQILMTILVAVILTGCGGGGGTETPPTNNSPTPASTAESSAAQSLELVSSVATSSAASIAPPSKPITSIASSSLVASTESSYIRASRSSLSSSSVSDFPDDFIPEKPEEIMDLPPSAPTEITLVGVSVTNVSIQWSAATDDYGISNYEIRRNGVYVGSSPSPKTSFVDTGLTANTAYIYTVRAVDTIGHRSGFSPQLTAKTQPGSNSYSSSTLSASSTLNSSSSSSSSSSLRSTSTSSTSAKSLSSSSSVSRTSSSALSSASSSAAAFAVEWRIPDERENGDYLELYEIGGYELRHMPAGSSIYSSTIIPNAAANRFIIPASTRDDTYEVAAFDVNGLYSRFIKLTPR